MNKRILCLGLMLWMVFAAVGVRAQTATIQLDFIGSEPPAKVYVEWHDVLSERTTRDSLLTDQGRAHYSLPVVDVTQVTVYDQTGIKDRDRRAVVYVTGGTTEVNIPDALPYIVVRNSPIHKQYLFYKNFTVAETEAFERWTLTFGQIYENKPLLDSLRPYYISARQALDSINAVFFQRYPASWFSLQVINDQITSYLTSGMYSAQNREIAEQLNRSFDSLDDALKESPFGKKVADRLKGGQTALVGNSVIDFSLPDKDGNLVDTKQMRGKIYLIDFWGSWCVWCRRGHPHLKELYERYHAKGFEIVAIGYEFGKKDTHRAKWLKAIEQDELPWKHVLNDNDVINLPQTYGVQVYPSKILVDQNGQIILRVTGDPERELDAKLAELFD